MRRFGAYVTIAAVLFAIAGFSTAGYYKYRTAELALEKDSVEAVNAAQEQVRGKAIAVLGDSLVAVTRRAVQAELARDAIDKELKSRSVSRATLTATTRPLNLERGSTEAVADGTVHFAAWRGIRHEPYTLDSLRVYLPEDTTLAPGFSLALRLDPAELHVRSQCELDGADGVHRARTTVTGPTWLTVAVRSTAQDPSMCSPNAARITDGSRLGPVVSTTVKVVGVVLLWEYVVQPGLRRLVRSE